jgi:hypothetical protein
MSLFPTERRASPAVIPVSESRIRLSLLAAGCCLALVPLSGCLFEAGQDETPAVADSKELRQEGGGDRKSGATPGSLCTRKWDHALADTLWICPDPRPPGAP